VAFLVNFTNFAAMSNQDKIQSNEMPKATSRHKRRYILGFISIMIVFYIVYVNDRFDENVLKPFIGWQTQVASRFLRLLGEQTTADGTHLVGSAASLNVAKGCDGIEVTALYLTGVLLMPFSRRSKLIGFGVGFSVLVLLNLIRITGLYWVQNYWPSSFDFLHLHGGFALFTIVALLLWMTWVNWAMRTEKQRQSNVSN
jgi:exosortase/archaeosortase family protein